HTLIPGGRQRNITSYHVYSDNNYLSDFSYQSSGAEDLLRDLGFPDPELVVLILPSFNQTVSEVGGQVNCLGTCSIGSVPLRMMGGQEC
ncbi:hypothetical protein, partial [Pseudomonas viridiflava]|uniref:hypothetical protein n=1 Tax=Pseudomonas viridiflava TaxID=33069 RepID=UPI0019D0301A